MDILSDVNINGKIFLGDENVFIDNQGCTIYLNANLVTGKAFCVWENIDCPEVHTPIIKIYGNNCVPSLKFSSDGINVSGHGGLFDLTDLLKRSPYGTVKTFSVPTQCSKFFVTPSEIYLPLVQAYKNDGNKLKWITHMVKMVW